MTHLPLRIANARGVPGCAGLFVNGELLVTNHHVAFGAGASPGDQIWAIPPDAEIDVRDVAVPLGWARHGTIGRVTVGEAAVFVDCALVEIGSRSAFPAWLQARFEQPWPRQAALPERNVEVSKTGPATRTTLGRILKADYCDHPVEGSEVRTASGQLLVEGIDADRRFAAPGDSGAAIIDRAGRVVGLLWGSTGNGDGIASPIGAVLQALGLGDLSLLDLEMA